jgi:demethylmenaquinone methyltransferase/2-methoxy-6-polyprenyl-1,4-benzoquinol methylase
MFDRISERYDLLNRVMSVGSDGRWRRMAVHALGSEVRDVLDLATGTADVALEVARRIPSSKIVGVDPSPGMLKVGRDKVQRAGLSDRIELREGDGQRIPASDNSFDAAIMAFGIRNVPDRAACLRELARVVRPGGPIVLLELAEPEGHPFSFAARFWKRRVVPRLGAMLSSTPEYAYLEKSIRAFPPPEEFLTLMGECGLREVEARALTFGAATIFLGRAP